MKLTSESKIFFAITSITIGIVGFAVIFLSQPPKPLLRSELATPSAYMRGPKNAAVYLVEFSDFQCPACKLFAGTVDDLAQTYPDKLLIVYRHFPLDQHPQSRKAAYAAEAAGKQGKFWEMAKLLFEHQDVFTDEKFMSFAKELGLDLSEFAKTLSDGSMMKKVQDDRQYGERIGIQATPTFFLNGVRLEFQTVDDLRNAVNNSIQ